MLLSYGHLPDRIPELGGLLLGTLFGEPIGALAAPVVAFSLLRQVPLGRAIGVTATGTVLGGVVAARAVGFIDLREAAMLVAVPGAIVGFVASAAWLRVLAYGDGAAARARLERRPVTQQPA